jgi:hypothetical protein
MSVLSRGGSNECERGRRIFSFAAAGKKSSNL